MTTSISLTVTGMKCGGCESSVNEALGKLNGVLAVKPMHKENKVEVEYDSSMISQDEIVQTITEAGFTVVE
jgi:copper chaperone